MRQAVHRQATVWAGDQQLRGEAVGLTHAVADKEDDVLGMPCRGDRVAIGGEVAVGIANGDPTF
jgi:hypothetical protein